MMTKALATDVKRKPMHIGGFQFEFADGGVAGIPNVIHLIPTGEWEHDLYGPISITPQDIAQFKANFDGKIRNGVAITAGHEGFAELPAQGWITRVECRDTGLWGEVDWNELGKQTLSDKQYKFFSPEFYREYEDPETHEKFQNVLTGGALTKSPYFKELEAIVFSDKKVINKIKTSETTMDLATILAKAKTDLSAEEKAFIVEHKAELTAEQTTEFADVLTPVEAESEADKAARETREANVAAGLNEDGTAKSADTEVAASEKKLGMVQINASELAILREKADQGAAAFAENKKIKLDAGVAKLSFSSSNKEGRFLPKSATVLRTFMESLNDAQMTQFTALVSQLPKSELFTEKGDGHAATEGATSYAEIERRIKVKTDADPKLKYSDALKQVMSESAAAGEKLEQRYDESLPKASKVAA